MIAPNLSGGHILKPRLFLIAAVISLIVALPVSKVLAKNKAEIEKRDQKIKQLEKKLQSKVKSKSVVARTGLAEAAEAASQPQPAPAPTPAPTVAPPPQPTPVPAPSLAGCEQYRGLVAQYNWPVNIMMAIMQAESTCRANAIGGPNYNGTYDYGLFQINNEPILDPAQNIARAYGKYTTQGLKAWSVYTSGKYLQYLR